MCPSRTSGAAAAHEQIDFRRAKPLGQLHIDFRYCLIEAKRLPAGFTGEMRVMTVRSGFGRCLLWIDHKAPHPVIASDAMRDALIHQPFEYPVNGDAINCVVIGQHASNIQMRCRALACQQASQHRNTRLCQPFTGCADGGFGGGKMCEISGRHEELHLTRWWWHLQLSSMKIK